MILNKKGSGNYTDIAELTKITSQQNDLFWIHLHYSAAEARKWLHDIAHLDPIIKENLLDDDTRPRSMHVHDNLFLSLRGVNLNPGSDPEDMIAVRLWATENYIITSNRRKLLSLEDISTALLSGQGPCSAAAFITTLIQRVTLRAGKVVEELEDNIEDLEETIDTNNLRQRNLLSDLRRDAIRLKRYFSPQKEALIQLLADAPPWITKEDKRPVRESVNKLNRYLETLDSTRDRAIVLHEEFLRTMSEILNQRMYTLSLVATLFLPLGFLTGLLGINVGGIPGAESPYGFLTICLGIAVLVVAMVGYLKIKKWY
ncbi:zinc transporter [Desulforhopalus singaporensis]|uniref:Zinc transporter n=2 Tax=Desulforhopalus singaporensis TaxID=91360 RepID=A0A1H0UHW5_9BACT|nr:zinc transporter [Desulforhopalus singaporensis]